jgi:hypothetical protein
LSQTDDRFQRLQAITAALDPLIDYCLSLGIHSAEFEAALRVAFVKRAAAVLPGNKRTNGKASHASISLATGLNRGEVQDILSSGDAGAAERMQRKSEKHTTSVKLLAIWETTPRYRTNSGAPRDLPLEPHEDGPSFTELVEKALPGKPPRHVLKELRRRGLVQQLADEIIRYRPRPNTSLTNTETTTELNHAAEQQKLLGHILFRAPQKPGTPKDFQTYIASVPVSLPSDQLPVVRAAVVRRMNEFTQSFVRDYGNLAEERKSPKKVSTKKVGISVFTWERK